MIGFLEFLRVVLWVLVVVFTTLSVYFFVKSKKKQLPGETQAAAKKKSNVFAAIAAVSIPLAIFGFANLTSRILHIRAKEFIDSQLFGISENSKTNVYTPPASESAGESSTSSHSSTAGSTSSIVSTPVSSQKPSVNSEASAAPVVSSKSETTANSETDEFDLLQNLFIVINAETTIEDIEKFIVKTNLPYTKEEYNKSSKGKTITYCIAYTEGAAKQSYADSGDYLNISFDNGNNDKIMYAVYNPLAGYTALFYNYGTYFEFSDNNAKDYSGYYVSDFLGENKGIVIKYSNGNEHKTNYFKYPNAKIAIEKALNKNH